MSGSEESSNKGKELNLEFEEIQASVATQVKRLIRKGKDGWAGKAVYKKKVSKLLADQRRLLEGLRSARALVRAQRASRRNRGRQRLTREERIRHERLVEELCKEFLD